MVEETNEFPNDQAQFDLHMTEIEERLYSHIYHNSSTHLSNDVKNDISLSAEIQQDKSFVCETSDLTNLQMKDDIIAILSNDSEDDIVEIVEKKPICIVIDSDNEEKNLNNGKNECFVISDLGRCLNNSNHQIDIKKENSILGKNKLQTNKRDKYINRNNMNTANSSKIARFNISISKSLDPHSISGDYSQFNHNSIIAKMKKDRNQWKINYTDLQGPLNNMWEKRVRCHNCHQMGHVKLRCPDPIRAQICYMCGLEGHSEPRCPKRMCLACGIESYAFVIGCHKCSGRQRIVCSLCNMAGHTENTCPDLWRRYHRSIDPTKSPIVQHSGLKDTQDLFCSNCSARGHIYNSCNKLRSNEHSLILPNIIKYDAVLPVQSTNLNTKSKSSLINGNTADVKAHNRINRQIYSNKTNNVKVRIPNECLDEGNQVSDGVVSPDINNSLQKEPQSLNADNTNTIMGIDNNTLEKEPHIFDFIRPAHNNTTNSDSVSLVIDRHTISVLMKPEGANFLHNASKSLNTKIEIQLSRYGGLLYLNDYTKEQSFRKLLKDWIKAINTKLLSTYTFVKLPNKTKSLINFIQTLKAAPYKQISNPASKYRTLKNITNNDYSVISSKQVKLYHKTIRQLNLFFFVQNDLREGEFHAKKLNELVKKLDTISEAVIPKELYEEIKSHYDYIFATDHGNYKELIETYKKKINKNI